MKKFCAVKKTEDEEEEKKKKRKNKGYNVVLKGVEYRLNDDDEHDDNEAMDPTPDVAAEGRRNRKSMTPDSATSDSNSSDLSRNKKKKNSSSSPLSPEIRHCCILRRDNFIVRHARMLIDWPPFEAVVLLAIIANCVVMAMEEYYPKGDPRNNLRNLDKSEAYFVAIFTAEAVIKIVALGFVLHPGSYLRSAWNVLDFVVVVTGLVTVLAADTGVNLRILRAIRVLRPLKLVAGIPSLQIVLSSIIVSMVSLLQVWFTLWQINP